MRAGGAAGGPHGADRLAPSHALADLDAHLVEVEVERVETEAVVHGNEAAREEVLGDQRDTTVVDRDHRCTAGGGVVDPGVRRSGLVVDDPAGAEATAGLLPTDRAQERAPPQALRGDRAVERLEHRRLRERASLRLGIEIHHAPRQRQPLNGELTPADTNTTSRVAEGAVRLTNRHRPRLVPGPQLEIEADQRGIPARIAEERDRAAA